MTAQEWREWALNLWRPILARLGPDHYMVWLGYDMETLIEVAYQEGRESVLEKVDGETRERMAP